MRTPTRLVTIALAAAAVVLQGCTVTGPGEPIPPDIRITDSGAGSATGQDVERLRVEVIEVRPHDPTSFTQGFELVDGVLYEGTGLEGESAMLATDPVTGAQRQRVDLDANLFGEGITVVGDRVWQLTWQNGVAIERDRASLAELRRVSYDGEGWGVCHDGARLVMSDGTDRLTFRDPATFDVRSEVRVTDGGSPLVNINELECVDGAVWANVWQTDRIVRIDPGSGAVTASVDAAGLLAAHADEAARGSADVLNGIASVDGEQFLVTGKKWPITLLVRFVPA